MNYIWHSVLATSKLLLEWLASSANDIMSDEGQAMTNNTEASK